jgi:hypothetical protein
MALGRPSLAGPVGTVVLAARTVVPVPGVTARAKATVPLPATAGSARRRATATGGRAATTPGRTGVGATGPAGAPARAAPAVVPSGGAAGSASWSSHQLEIPHQRSAHSARGDSSRTNDNGGQSTWL